MSGGAGTSVGVVGDGSDVTDRLVDALADAGERGDAASVLERDVRVIVAVGERAFIDVASEAPDVPVLPVGAGRGVRSVPRDDAAAAARGLVDGDWPTEAHPLLAVALDGESRGVAVTDVTVVTAEAAHISEYELTAGEDALGRVRADGVVVATPAGSPGYARRLGAPVLGPGTGAVVAPIAPFATDPDHWVVDPDGVTVAPARREAPVELVVDDSTVGRIDPSQSVSCRVDGRVSTIVLPESASRYG